MPSAISCLRCVMTGKFSAPFFLHKAPGLVNPPVNPSRCAVAALNLLLTSTLPFRRALGDGKVGDEDPAGVGLRANTRGGDEERSTMVDIVGVATSGHRCGMKYANAVS